MELHKTPFQPAYQPVAAAALLVFCLLALTSDASAQNTQGSRVVPTVLSATAASRPGGVSAELESSKTSSFVTNNLDAAAGVEQRAFKLVNDTRLKNGLPALTWDQELCRMARIHSQNMALQTFFSHVNGTGLGPKERAVQAGIKPFRRIAENIAYNWGFEDPGAYAVERWMISPGHRENILAKQYQASAIGVFVKPNGAVYITQVFISR
jgi:uncharacterized protein YkwD